MRVKKQNNEADRFMRWLELDEEKPGSYQGKHRAGKAKAKRYNKKYIVARRKRERRNRKAGRQ